MIQSHFRPFPVSFPSNTFHGTLEFKTDNKDLFDFSLEEMKNAEGWELTAFTYDLHHDVVLSEGNVMTEYEEKFSSIGNPICKMEARFL